MSLGCGWKPKYPGKTMHRKPQIALPGNQTFRKTTGLRAVRRHYSPHKDENDGVLDHMTWWFGTSWIAEWRQSSQQVLSTSGTVPGGSWSRSIAHLSTKLSSKQKVHMCSFIVWISSVLIWNNLEHTELSVRERRVTQWCCSSSADRNRASQQGEDQCGWSATSFSVTSVLFIHRTSWNMDFNSHQATLVTHGHRARWISTRMRKSTIKSPYSLYRDSGTFWKHRTAPYTLQYFISVLQTHPLHWGCF